MASSRHRRRHEIDSFAALNDIVSSASECEDSENETAEIVHESSVADTTTDTTNEKSVDHLTKYTSGQIKSMLASGILKVGAPVLVNTMRDRSVVHNHKQA